MISITHETIDEMAVLEAVKSNACGAAVLFVGTTRQFTANTEYGMRETTRLDYECFEEMALKEFATLVERVQQKWPIEKCSVVHRVGVVEVGQTSIALAVSSPHRVDAFSAAEWLMDELKRVVPIWKKENWIDGSTEWVHPGVETNSVSSTAKED